MPMLEVLFCFAIGMVLLFAAVKDFKTMMVSNIYPYSILVLGLLNHWLLVRSPDYLLGSLLAIPFLWGFYRNKGGGADVKLVIALGLYQGLSKGFLLIFVALLTAVVTEGLKCLMQKKRSPYPFVPYLLWGYLFTVVSNFMKAGIR